MIAALKRLQKGEPHDLPGEMAALGISGTRTNMLNRLFMSHPPLAERIAALEQKA